MPAVICPACSSPCTVADGATGAVVCPRCKKPFRLAASSAKETLPLTKRAAETAKPGVVGRYRVEELLGTGAFGTVYRAHDPALDRRVALKLLRPEALASPEAVERFRREAKAAARMLHAHIVPVYDCGEHAGAGYVASAFIEGEPLSRLVPEVGMEPRRAAGLVAQLLDALAYAHEQGVTHRDVKPANCLVDGKGHLYLTDFGLAGSLGEAATRMTRLGAVMGTPAYMAPEQAKGNTREVGPKSDQYAAGVVLYELLTGSVPFAGPPDVVLFNVVSSQPPKPSTLRAGLDSTLEAICLEAMAKKPEDRFADAGQFAANLRAWLAGARKAKAAKPADAVQPAKRERPAAVQKEKPSAEARPAAQRSGRRGVLAAVAVVALLGVGAAVAFSLRGSKPAKPDDGGRVAGVDPRKDGLRKDVTPPEDSSKKDGEKAGHDKDVAPDKTEKRPPRNEAERRWLAEAEKGDKDAQIKLGVALAFDGKTGRPRPTPTEEVAEGARWLKKAVDQDDDEARTALGILYGNGMGVPVNHKEAARLWRIAAAKGHRGAATWLAEYLEAGNGIDQDLPEAIRLYNQATAKNFSPAQWRLGRLYRDGRGVTKDLAEAERLLRLAADAGHAAAKEDHAKLLVELADERRRWLAEANEGDVRAQASLGAALAFGKGGAKRDPAEGAKWLKKAADQGDGAALADLGLLHERGEGVARDPAEAVKLYKLAAAKKDSAGMTRLGRCYEDGIGLGYNDVPEAVRLYADAAKAGHPEALWLLGIMRRDGRGGDPDPKEAERLFRLADGAGQPEAKAALARLLAKEADRVPTDAERRWLDAARKGDARAQSNLGWALLHDRDRTQRDGPEGVKWLKKALENGDEAAQVSLGLAYARGEGVRQDYAESARLFRLAAARNDAYAVCMLGRYHEDGLGVAKDLALSVRYYEQAEKLGSAQAYWYHGLLYRDGRGVRKDLAEARRLLKLAADGGFEHAKADLAELDKK